MNRPFIHGDTTFMAESCMVISQAEISALKDTLCAQQKLLQKLYNELDAEREASASAASEALNVILRLQGEKAAVKMEAEQYKRLAEEKMCHAEESFAIIEDIICQKEMEVAALDYQVESYRYKLMSMGCDDPGDGELKYPENLLQRSELSGEASLQQLGRRNSAPLLLKCKKAMLESESSNLELDFVSKIVDEPTSQEHNDFAFDSEKKHDHSTHGAINCYGEQIRELEMRIKEIMGANYASSINETRTPSLLSSQPSGINLANSQHETRLPSPQLSIVDDIDHTKHSRKKVEAIDVFEVPQADHDSRSHESSNRDKKKKILQTSEIVECRHCAHPEAVKVSKDEPDWLKKLFQSTQHEKSLCKPSDIAAIDRGVVQPSTSVAESRSSLNITRRNSGISEVEKQAESNDRDEQLKLLKEIKEKLTALQDEIRCQNVTKSLAKVKPPLNPLPEAMLSFWL